MCERSSNSQEDTGDIACLLGRSSRAGNIGRKEETPIKAGKRSINALSSLKSVPFAHIVKSPTKVLNGSQQLEHSPKVYKSTYKCLRTGTCMNLISER